MTALEFTGVTLAHGKRVLADDVSFTLPEGSLTLLTGPNGNGKTTMLRAVLGLHPVTRGRISVFGAPPRGGTGTIGYLPQHRRLPAPQLCGRDLLTAAWRGTRWGLPNFGRTCRRAVDEALSVAGATDLARRPLAVLSGGERQRVFLAEALVNDPSLLILDEPLAGMDTVWQGRVARLLSDLKRKRNLTMLVCTHDLETLMPETDHILHMDGTRCVARDPHEGAHV